MQDRVPLYPGRVKLTPVSGQADVYDMVRADQPTQEGTPLNKASLLKDATAALFGFGTDSVPDDMLNALAHTGDLHVWKRTQNGQIDYPVSPNPNAYQEGSDGQPAGYTLGEEVTQNTILVSGTNKYNSVTYYYADSLSVSDDGTIPISQFTSNVAVSSSKDGLNIANSTLKGKFVVKKQNGNSADTFPLNTVYFIPADANFYLNPYSGRPNSAYVYVDKYQTVTGYPAIPANITIEYMGQLGDKARIVTGSYVGTGKSGSGSSNQNTLVFESIPKVLFISGSLDNSYPNRSQFGMIFYRNVTQTTSIGFSYGSEHPSTPGAQINAASIFGPPVTDNKISWYSGSEYSQLNVSGIIYTYYAIF